MSLVTNKTGQIIVELVSGRFLRDDENEIISLEIIEKTSTDSGELLKIKPIDNAMFLKENYHTAANDIIDAGYENWKHSILMQRLEIYNSSL